MNTIAFLAGLAVTLISAAVLGTMIRMLLNDQRNARLQGITDLVPISFACALIIVGGLIALVGGLAVIGLSFG